MTKNLQRKIKNTGFVLSLAFGFLMLSGITANAQYNNDDYYRRQEQRRERQQRREEQRENRDNGYYGNNGNNGNNDGYYGNNDRNGNYGNNNRYGNNIYRIAQQNGYNDGLRKGAEDARERHNNPTGTSEYKRATNGYNSSYGNKNEYRDAYRQAFLQGFNESQSRYYNNGRYGNRNGGGYNTGNAGRIFRGILGGY